MIRNCMLRLPSVLRQQQQTMTHRPPARAYQNSATTTCSNSISSNSRVIMNATTPARMTMTTAANNRGAGSAIRQWLRNCRAITNTTNTSHYSLFSTRALSPVLPTLGPYDRPPTYTRPQVLHGPDGRQVALFRPVPASQRNKKLAPHIVARRLRALRTYMGRERNIRHSPWRLNLLCQFTANLPLQEALQQLQFSKKSHAPLVYKVLKRTSNLADIRDGLQISQLEVAECFATRATPLKRINIMGRGRHGKLEHRHAHMRVVLREIDFRLRIFQARSMNQKRRWFELQQQAERDAARATAEREQVQRLERQAAEKKAVVASASEKKN
jgi:ribosomal protein L22